jgi:hypothetical protein
MAAEQSTSTPAGAGSQAHQFALRPAENEESEGLLLIESEECLRQESHDKVDSGFTTYTFGSCNDSSDLLETAGGAGSDARERVDDVLWLQALGIRLRLSSAPNPCLCAEAESTHVVCNFTHRISSRATWRNRIDACERALGPRRRGVELCLAMAVGGR